MQSVELKDVTLEANGRSGLILEDQNLNSAAGTRLLVDRSSILDNGFDPTIDDYDGIRVNEGGEGDVEVTVSHSKFEGNAADGLEIDEKGAGDVHADLRHSHFDDNGTQPQLPSDLEDGFDIDEADAGDIRVRILNVTANGNYDGGLDLDEEGPGDVVMFLQSVTASGNYEEGIKATEDKGCEPNDAEDGPADPVGCPTSSGNIEAHFVGVTTVANGNVELTLGETAEEDNIQLEEFGAGDVVGTFVDLLVDDSGDEGLEITEDTELDDLDSSPSTGGSIDVQINRSVVTDNDGDGIKVEEFGAGDVGSRIAATTATGNGSDDIEYNQESPGAGVLRLQNVTYDERDQDGVTVIEVP
jgi:hypothetical protein